MENCQVIGVGTFAERISDDKTMLYDNYFHSISGGDFNLQRELRYAKRIFERYYQPYITGGSSARILEVGCGFGKILWAATQCGFSNIEGVDISEDQIAYARNELGLKAERGDAIERLRALRSELDVVMIIDVLEHCALEYGLSLLKMARTALKPGGIIIVQVPNGLSPLAPTYHGDVTHIRAFSPQSLAQLLRLSGYRRFGFHAMLPIVHGPLSAIRHAIWRFIVTPGIMLYLLMAMGGKGGGIFTPNIVAVAVDD